MRRFALTVVLTVFAATVAAQRPPIRNLGSEDGLAHPQVWAIYQDEKGYLWLGTTGGLSRYDGSTFVNWGARDGLGNQTVRAIAEDDQGNLWLGTDGGVARFDGKRIESFAGNREAPGGTVWAILRDQWGHMWFANQYDGLFSWRNGRFVSWDSDDGLISDYVYGLEIDSEGKLWLGHRGSGVTRCEIDIEGLGECEQIPVAVGEESGRAAIHDFVETEEGDMWAATRGAGVLRFSPDGAIDQFGVDDGLSESDVYSIELSSDGELVIGTVHEGLNVCRLPDLGECRIYDESSGLRAQTIHSTLIDDERNVWVGTESGLSRIGSIGRLSISTRDGLPNDTIYSLMVVEDGVWVGTLKGMSWVDTSEDEWKITTWEGGEDLAPNEGWDFAEVRGRTWMATEDGLCEVDRERGCFQRYTTRDGLLNDDVISLATGRKPDELIAAVLDGVSLLEITEDRLSPYIENLALDTFELQAVPYGLAVDELDRVWIGTDRGLVLMEGKKFTASWSAESGLPVIEITTLIAGSDGKLWIGSNGSGLISATLPRRGSYELEFQTWGAATGVPAEVGAIAEGEGDDLWIGSDDGLHILDRGLGRARPVFDRLGGLAGNEINALAVDGSAVWIGASGGVTRYQPELDPPYVRAPRVVIESLRRYGTGTFTALFGQSSEGRWLPDMDLAFPSTDNNLRFQYKALSFRDESLLRYQVRLIGFNPEWSEPTAETFKEYTNLDPGEYEFQVRASKLGETWSEPASMGFRVRPAWFQTSWFYATAAVATLLLILAGWRARTYQMRARNVQLEAIVQDRTADLRRYARALEEHSQALDRANLRIREADRIKSEFLTNMSHELRTPLNSIIGFSDVLLEKLSSKADAVENRFLRNVGNSGRYLLLLINNLLDLSKIESGQMELNVETVSPGSVLDQTCEVVQGYAQDREVTIRTEVAPEMPRVEVDPAKLNQIILNLLSNAIKFSEPGSEVVVRMHPFGDRRWIVEVEDSGPGIPAKDQSRIFDEFRQAASATHPGGTGLGLALVKRFARLMGGDVTLQSEEGEGSCFRVNLPLEVVETDVESGEGWMIRDTSPRILLIENDPGSLARLATLLENAELLPVRMDTAHLDSGRIEEVEPVVVVCDISVDPSVVYGRRDPVEDPVSWILCVVSGSKVQLAAGFDQLVSESGLDRLETVVESLRPLDGVGRALRVLAPEWLDPMLSKLDVEITWCSESDDVIGKAASNDVVIVDVADDLRGVVMAHRVQNDRRTRHLPIIAIRRADFTGASVTPIGQSTVEDLPLLVHELVRRRSGRMVRRAASSLR